MITAHKKPNNKPAGAGVSVQGATDAKKFNENLRYVEGTRSQISQGSTTVTISLNSSGKQMLGLSIIPVSGTLVTLADTQVKFVINNNNLLLFASANNLNPNFVSNMIFFPTPQPLFGNDTIKLEFNKNDAGTVFVITNIFYIPRI